MMKMMTAVLITAAFAAGTASAADVMVMKKGVSFNHKAHSTALKECKKCHEADKGGKIAGFGKDFAHKNCKGCHAEMKQGPTACKGCHIK